MFENRIRLFIVVFCVLVIGSLLANETRAQADGGGTLPPANSRLYLPSVGQSTRFVSTGGCPSTSTTTFASIPVIALVWANGANYASSDHPDLNLAVRGYTPTPALLQLLTVNGPTDPDAPQLDGIFADRRLPEFLAAYQVFDWNWDCDCLGAPLSSPPVTLLSMAANEGEPLYPPSRRAEIHAGAYVAMVLYAERTRITLAYTREDSPAFGYVVHVEDICVDPNLLAAYQTLDTAGRRSLPALHNGESFGVASEDAPKVAVRDTGTFMDPRSRKDWWQAYPATR